MTFEEYKKKAAKIPDGPGVYFFLGARGQILYIGKATSLRDRVRSYFAGDVAHARGPLVAEMLRRAKKVQWRAADSVLEALLLEASLIRLHKPRYNSAQKDDKSFNRVVITREDFPRVLLIREKELASATHIARLAYTFGPFPHGVQLQQALKLIRKIFPYRTKCAPHSGTPCFDRQLGLCPGVCTGEIGKTEYRRTVRHIVLLFEGRKKLLLKSLEREMRRAAGEERFEEAARLRKQLFALRHVQDVSLIRDEFKNSPAALGTIRSTRIEAYDVAHLRGAANVGVMAVVEDGAALPSEYRKFLIRTAAPGDDPGALREILSRRFDHAEWRMPRLVVVDGAAAHMNAAKKILGAYGFAIPVVGVVKDERHRPREIRGSRESISGRENEILLANAEAHRFAVMFHRKQIRSKLLKRE